MSKKIPLLALTWFLVINIFAQRPEWEKMPITYLQLPSMPVSPMANKYQLNVVLGNYDYYPQSRDIQSIKAGLQLNGCQQVSVSPQFKLNVNLVGFSLVNQQMRMFTIASPTGNIPRFCYDVSYVYKISYQVLDGNGNPIRDGIIYGSETPEVRSTMAFPNQYELEIWWSYPLNRNDFYSGCENEAFQHAIYRAGQQLNSELGFNTINTKVEVANFKESAYADLQAAFGNVTMGYNLLVNNKTQAIDYISQGIQGWEGALSEFNGTDKHARIDERVAVALYVNLVLAYCYIENWDKSNLYIAKLKSLEKEEYKKKIAETIDIEMDYERRAKANITQ